MTIFMVETYVIKPGKLADFTAYKKKVSSWKENHPELFKPVKSYRMFAQVLGDNWGGYVEMWEFQNMADCETWMNIMMQ